MSLKVGLEYDRPLGGVMAFSSFFNKNIIKQSPQSIDTPIYVHNGENDELIKWDFAENTYRNLERDFIFFK